MGIIMSRFGLLRKAFEDIKEPVKPNPPPNEGIADFLVKKLQKRENNPAITLKQTESPIEVVHPHPPDVEGTPLTVSAAGFSLLKRPHSEHKLHLKYLQFSNKGTNAVTVHLRFHRTGKPLFTTHLAAGGGTMNANLTDTHVHGTIGSPLYVHLSEESTGGIEVMVLTNEVD